MSVLDVTARISQIQAQLAAMAPAAPASSPTAGADFSTALQDSTAQLGRPLTGDAGGQSAGAGTDSGAGGAAGAAVVADARKYLGVPYVWGGTDPTRGLDCSGLVQRVYADLGYSLPRVSGDQARAGRPVAGLDQAQPGDVLAFGSPVHHVGIYIGDGQMIEAPRPGLDVRVGPVWETPTAIRRIVPDAASVGGLGAAVGRVAAGTPYADLFAAAGQKYGVDPTLLAAVARQESGYDPSAISAAGAQGLMQLMPGTASGLGVSDAFDPAQSVDGAARLLHGLLARFGTPELALAAYNAGPGAVLRYGGVPPYSETRNYVQSVMTLWGRS